MRIAKFLPVLFTLLAFNSCQKELASTDPTSPNPPGTTSSKVKTYTEDVSAGGSHSVVTYNLSYDANDKLLSLVSTSNAGDKFVYQYFSNSATLDIYNSNTLSIHNVFFLNGSGLVDSAFQYNDTKDTSTDKYYYNSAKQLTEDIEYEYSGGVPQQSNILNYEYDAKGNVTKETDDFAATTYDYYPDKINNISIQTPYAFVGKNLIKTTTYDDGSGPIVINHTYTFDSSNRIITETDTVDNGDIFIKRYTYY